MKRILLISLLLLTTCAARQAPVGLAPLAGSTTNNPMYYVPYAIDQPHATSCTDGSGHTVTGGEEPDYDTLLGIENPTSSSQTARVRVYNQSGVAQTWSGVAYKDITLAAGHSIGFSFIPGNPYSDPPQSWKGYITVESTGGGRLNMLAMLSGGGCYPSYWNIYSASLPVLEGPLVARSVVYIPFMNIVWTTDANHPNGYATGLTITNFDSVSVTYKTTYTVGDGYTGAGTSYSWNTTLAAGASTDFDVYTQAHAAGYTATLSEGNVKIEMLNSSGAAIAAKTGIYMLQADGNYRQFSAGYNF